jgi:hypothetical protein
MVASSVDRLESLQIHLLLCPGSYADPMRPPVRIKSSARDGEAADRKHLG